MGKCASRRGFRPRHIDAECGGFPPFPTYLSVGEEQHPPQSQLLHSFLQLYASHLREVRKASLPSSNSKTLLCLPHSGQNPAVAHVEESESSTQPSLQPSPTGVVSSIPSFLSLSLSLSSFIYIYIFFFLKKNIIIIFFSLLTFPAFIIITFY